MLKQFTFGLYARKHGECSNMGIEQAEALDRHLLSSSAIMAGLEAECGDRKVNAWDAAYVLFKLLNGHVSLKELGKMCQAAHDRQRGFKVPQGCYGMTR